MLLLASDWLRTLHSGFGVIDYLTLRTILGVLTALVMALMVGPLMIRRLSAHQIGQQVRSDGPSSHLGKSGTPTMGGLLILSSIAASTLIWSDLGNHYVWVVLLTTLAFGCIGFVDDWRKVALRDARGLLAREKYFWQSVVGLGAAIALWVMASHPSETALIVPFVKSLTFDLGIWFVPFAYLVIVGSSNAVNLTDGLDGLAILPTVLVAGGLVIFAYTAGNVRFAEYLGVPYVPGVGEVAVFCGAMVGAGLGFLWFNTYPAQVFMGDIGALALGAGLGIVAVVVRQELALFIMGGIFVAEALSVILQVASYRLTGRRIFNMAPLHHHFELMGWPEPRVIVRFWIVTVILVLVGLSSLKIR